MWAHPRSRGENAGCVPVSKLCIGSSPLTRGKLHHVSRVNSEHGLIPAHAGKTHGSRRIRQARRAHPRSRGENRGLIQRLGEPQGSSPLTRGKHGLTRPHLSAIGLIPAHAGKTRLSLRPTPPKRAHPRSRGENVLEEIGGDVEKGSSPLTRGKRPRGDRRRRREGLIPAHAGKTPHPRLGLRLRRAHPRSRGENC